MVSSRLERQWLDTPLLQSQIETWRGKRISLLTKSEFEEYKKYLNIGIDSSPKSTYNGLEGKDMTREDKLERTTQILRNIQVAAEVPKCDTCVWRKDHRAYMQLSGERLALGLVMCTQPLVASVEVDHMGKAKYQKVTVDNARLGLCGPSGDLFLPKNKKELRADHWNEHSKDYAIISGLVLAVFVIAGLVGLGVAYMGWFVLLPIGIVLWILGAIAGG